MTKTFTGCNGTYEVSTRNGRVRVSKIEGFCSSLIVQYETRHRRLAEMYADKLANGKLS